ncbi:MAG: TonB-dependent receptor, partial [Chitinophagaceae bacterium]
MKSIYGGHHFSKKILTSIICGLSLTVLTQTAGAQIGSSNVHGVVALQEQPQAGLEVIAKNIQNGYTFRAITQKDGTYVFNGLRPGNYQVYLQEKNGKNPEPIELKVGQSVTLDFQLEKSTSADNVEEVLVIGSQLKNTSNGGEVGTTVSLEEISKLPQNTRNFLAFADLAPGVQFTQATDGSTKIKGGAQSANAINVFIDGVGQKNYVLGGGITGQDSSRGNPFPQSAIGQYKVITQNYSAEYDQLSSAAIVAVTASGTNEFHGGLFYDYTDEGMRELRPSEIASSKKVPSKQGQYGFTLGGPIIQDKMHFFFAYESKDNSDPKDMTISSSVTLPAQYQELVKSSSADFEEDLYFGKLDYLISDEQKIELTAKIRKENELTSIGGINVLSYGTDKKNDETRIDLSHNWRTDSWINDVHLSYEDATYNPRAHTTQNGIKLVNANGEGILNIGGGEDYQSKGQK